MPIRASIRWTPEHTMELCFDDETSRAWASANVRQIAGLLDEWNRRWAMKPVVMSSDPDRRDSVGSRAASMGNEIRSAFPRETFDIRLHFREPVTSYVDRQAAM